MIDAKFWHERWEKNEIPFHERKANPLLVKNMDRLGLRKGARVFVPLCGKTRDIGWLLSKGFRVVGAELSSIAVEQLFAELGVEHTIREGTRVSHYSARGVDVFVGDIFDMTRKAIGRVNAIYDRAAFVALPDEVRKRYAAHLVRVTGGARQLLVTYDYNQAALAGPPFSISNAELMARYGKQYEVTLVSSAPLPGGLKGKCPALENVWLLKPKIGKAAKV